MGPSLRYRSLSPHRTKRPRECSRVAGIWSPPGWLTMTRSPTWRGSGTSTSRRAGIDSTNLSLISSSLSFSSFSWEKCSNDLFFSVDLAFVQSFRVKSSLFPGSDLSFLPVSLHSSLSSLWNVGIVCKLHINGWIIRKMSRIWPALTGHQQRWLKKGYQKNLHLPFFSLIFSSLQRQSLQEGQPLVAFF